MKFQGIILGILLLLMQSTAFAQLSPGDLSEAHSKLEGMSNCTQCHDLGKKVNNAKCLSCHKEIQQLVKQKKGYHASSEVASKDCFACHSEHHGKKFNMVRIDEKSFDHSLTKYKLEGKHATVDCKSCHKAGNIRDATIKKKENTYLGLESACLSCHDDYHQKTLSVNCVSCHSMEDFKPAKGFNHQKTEFALLGKHADVKCAECHKVTMKNGKSFQNFANTPHNDCVSCHSDPHGGRINARCDQCHSENSFKQFIGMGKFDHSTTSFSLRGKHKSVTCFKCHKNTENAATIFDMTPNVTENQCVACHKDVHNGRFGNNCSSCHAETSFRSVKSLENFDHARTDFSLVGKHVGVECNSCHKGSYTQEINFSLCKNCHSDYHKGVFVKDGILQDCSECHTVMKEFTFTTYSIDQHQKSKFSLQGAHEATACVACHQKEGSWMFRNIGNQCDQCHKDVHGEQFAVNKITDCDRCHDATDWVPRNFNHNYTNYPLKGKHVEVECGGCHKPVEKNGNIIIEYKITKRECIDCHS